MKKKFLQGSQVCYARNGFIYHDFSSVIIDLKRNRLISPKIGPSATVFAERPCFLLRLAKKFKG